MSSILFLVNHPEVYVNHRNYFEEKGFEVTMRHIWRYDYQHYDHVLCDRFISGGTLFLDEIENLSLRGQVTLSRALQELTFMKVGDYRVQKVDFNLVCTTNVKLWDLIDEGKFRSDLYYRIAHMEFTIPPVRDYHNIPGLMEFLIDQICEEYDLHLRIDRKDLVLDTMRKLDPYKGNIREIKSYLTKKLIELESTQRSTLTGIELMKSFKL